MLLTLDFFVTKLHHGKNGGGGMDIRSLSFGVT